MATIDSSSWETIVTTALLGTSHRPWHGDVLEAVATLSVYRRVASLLPPPLPTGPPAPDEAFADARMAAFFVACIELNRDTILDQWFDALGDEVAPPDVLPALLSILAAQPERERVIRPHLGERGRWLMAQREDWAFLADLSHDVWLTAPYERRLDVLRRVRQWEPDQARDWLRETFAGEAPERRAPLLRVLSARLGPQDEPFLVQASRDRRKEVRGAALDLLGQLPGSALVQTWQTMARAFFRDGTVPDPEAVKATGLDVKTPSALSLESWWWRHVVPRIPVEGVYAEAPPEAWEAWAAAARRFDDADAARALLRRHGGWAELGAASLFGILPADERERLLLSRFEGNTLLEGVSTWALLRAATFPWSPALSRHFVGLLATEVSQTRVKPHLSVMLADFAPWMDPSLLEEATRLLAPALNAGNAAVTFFMTVLNLRAQMTAARGAGRSPRNTRPP